MLNTMISIDCDQCGRYSDSVVLAFEPGQLADAVILLQSRLQEDGWHSFRNHYRCPDCLLENLATNQAL